MELEQVQKQFPIGSRVRVDDALRYKGFSFLGLTGEVCKIDEKAGVCVQFFFFKNYQPHWWFLPNVLGVDNSLQILPLSAEEARQCLGPRNDARTLQETKLSTWAMRCWLVATARAKPEQGVWVSAMDEKWLKLKEMYQGTNDKALNAWLEVNDTRVKRVLMMDLDDGPMDSAPIKRPKIS